MIFVWLYSVHIILYNFYQILDFLHMNTITIAHIFLNCSYFLDLFFKILKTRRKKNHILRGFIQRGKFDFVCLIKWEINIAKLLFLKPQFP